MSHRATVFFLLLALAAAIVSQAIGEPDDDARERFVACLPFDHKGA